ncbi:MAG TPA: FdtA/QdtA family cupin domain-containing protein [Bacteroidales bacterium]|nr:FdtA/QdtA family cupin domain-containing protein [Bacteroidales bacterium]
MELIKIHNPAGNITIVQNGDFLPFDIKRVYYLYDVPGGSERGGHAHKELHQLIVAASGSFDVILDDGRKRKIVTLNRPNYGLIIVPGIWREIINFSSGGICLVLASEKYDPDDYIRRYKDFLMWKSLK